MAANGGGSDWFKRTYNLAEGEEANLVYGNEFDQNEVELLELSPELLALVESGEQQLCFKGGPDDEAVLCTKDKTFLVKRVETSNTLLLMQPPGGLDDRISGGDGDLADADAAANDATPAAKRQKRRSSGAAAAADAAAPPPPAAEERVVSADGVCPVGEDGLKDLTAFAQADSHLELVLTAPRVDPMWDRLRAEPHVYAGPEHERELDEAWANEHDDNDCGEEGTPDPPPRGFTLDELIQSTQASEVEIQTALEDGPAFDMGGRWRGIDSGYLVGDDQTRADPTERK